MNNICYMCKESNKKGRIIKKINKRKRIYKYFQCTDCNTKSSAEWRKRNKHRVSKYIQKYNQINGEKVRCWQKLNHAVGNKVIRKPSRCDKCGKKSLLLDGHHEDYLKPLYVQWLCRACHKMI